MIKSFRHRGLKELYQNGRSKNVSPSLHKGCLERIDALDHASRPEDLKVPGFSFHALRGKPRRYSVHVSGNWCITFAWEDGNPIRVQLEDYH
ncbi:MAG: plasmid maintenance system killer [Rhodospirillaceae bacterium]|jgi:proteic killer suppression protein|nr:plasmid maintenance system killer [Rhodospirillaceae bacterium]MBT3884795.1 plasmid maintenance system killer [Rhodospirillaceae bacterium]MBT4118084.1 plasmid maintenance system killer [Rhodospirillaceae bacterium]MBT4674282.1 plasmid maintenance system killer [Rhodospirillaceae bacterium]MBT5179814.1 plasmid maintenance system killer [Rhodospirillaceae bacterium]